MLKFPNATVLAVCLGAGAMGSSLAAAQELKPGKWEVTIKTEMTGVPAPPQSRTMTYCVDEKNKNQPFTGNDQCKFSDKRAKGNEVSWTMTCEGQMQMTGEITNRIEDERYTGSSVIKMNIPGAPAMQVRGTYSGKFIGSC